MEDWGVVAYHNTLTSYKFYQSHHYVLTYKTGDEVDSINCAYFFQ